MTKIKLARVVTISLAMLLVLSGIFGALRYGGICSLGPGQTVLTDSFGFLLRSLDYWQTAFVCPLGFVERSLATGELLSLWSFSAALAILSVVLLGRVFCSWVCPASLLQRAPKSNGGLNSKSPTSSGGANWASYSSYAVLGGVLAASYLFRFPVFCFFCPVGLFFGALYAAIRYLSADTLGLELVIFPAMLGIELVALKSWCRSICPLGALLSIAGNLNRFLLPTLKKEKCLASKGINCQACKRGCPERIDVANLGRIFSPNSCTKCLDCMDRCPVGAIEIAILR